MNNLTNTIKAGVAAYVSFNAIQKVGSDMTEAAGGLEAYRGTLNVVMKDYEKAAQTMIWASKFANKTPFETDSVVEATVKLESYKLKAMEVLPKVGDMASVMNKDLIQAVEAVSDAQNGELERLKEFGITKQQIIEHGQKQLGLMDIVNNKGQITNQENLNKALFSLMEDRFSGGMEMQAGMYKGLMSTVSGVWKSGLATMAGVSMSGEVVDGSLFDMIKVNAKSVADLLTRFVEDGTFERLGQRIAGFFKFIGYGIDLAKAGMKKVWPYIKKTGSIIESLISMSIKKLKNFKPTFDLIGKKVNWFKTVFVNGFNKTKVIIEKNLPKLLEFRKSISVLTGNIKNGLSRAFEIAKPPMKWLIEEGAPLIAQGLSGVIGFATDLFSHFNDKWPEISAVFETVGGALRDGLVLGFETAKPIIEWIINDGFPLMSEVLCDVVDFGLDVYNLFADNWTLIEPIIVGITSALGAYKLAMVAVNVVTAVTNGLTTAYIGLLYAAEAAMAVLTSPITAIIAAIAAVIAVGWALYKNWDKVTAFMKTSFASAGKFVKGVGASIGNFFKGIATGMSNTWTSACDWIGGKFVAVGSWAVTTGTNISNAFIGAYTWVVEKWNGIGEWFSEKFIAVSDFALGLGESISGAFSTAYTWVTDAWSGLGGWFDGLWDGIGNGFKGYVNFFSKIMNWMIDGLNKISFDIPDWVPEFGGKSFGINIPKIPYLASGGITTGPTLAMIGEGKEQEAVLPLSKLSALLQLAVLRSRKIYENSKEKVLSAEDRLARFTNITNNNQKQTINIEYKPEFKFYGDVDKKDVKSVVKEGYKDFKHTVYKTFDQDKRLSLSN